MAGPSLIATLGANISQFVQDLNTAKGEARKGGEGIGSAFGEELEGKLKGLVAIGAFEELARSTIEYGSKVNDLSGRLGISTDAVQQWDYALKQSGSSIESAVPFFEKLGIARDKALAGNDKLAADFAKFGVSLNDLSSMRIEDIAAIIAKAVEVGDPQALIGPLREIGGKGAGELIAAMREGISEKLKEAPLISHEDILKLDELSDAFSRLKAQITSGMAEPLLFVTSQIQKILDGAAMIGAAFGGAFEKWKQAISGGIDTSSVGAAAASFGKILVSPFTGASEGIQGAVDSQDARDRAAASVSAAKQAADAKVAAATRAAEVESAASAQKVEAVNAQIEAETRRGELLRLNSEGQIEYISTEITLLEQQLAIEKDSLKAAGLKLAIRKDENEITRLQNAQDKEREENERKLSQLQDQLQAASRVKPVDYQVNSPQLLGGVIGSFTDTNEIQMIEVQKQSEKHLAQIKKDIAKLVEKIGGEKTGDDTKF